MSDDPLQVMLIGPDDAVPGDTTGAGDMRFLVGDSVDAALEDLEELDAVVIWLEAADPAEVALVRSRAPDLVIVTVGPSDAASPDEADDHLLESEVEAGLIPRSVRYSAGARRLRRELATQDEATGLLNLRGFTPMVEHHLRMADRDGDPVVFVFVRFSDLGDEREEARAAADVVLQALRASDVAARLRPDTFGVLLTGDADGTQSLVLSRLVEAIARHDARSEDPHDLSLSIATASYDPGKPRSFEEILEVAERRLRSTHSSDPG